MIDIRDLCDKQRLDIIGTTLMGCNNKDIQHLDIPEGVTEINDRAFYYFDKLYSVHLPKSLKAIGTAAFMACNNLAVVNFDEAINLTTIASEAFKHTSLIRIDLPKSLRVIDKEAFAYPYQSENADKYSHINTEYTYNRSFIQIRTPVIPKVLIHKDLVINENAFAGMAIEELFIDTNKLAPHSFAFSEVKKVTWNSEAQSLVDSAFFNCVNLSSFIITEHATNFLTKIGPHAFEGCMSLFEFTASDGIEVLCDWAFNRSSIEKFKAGTSLKNIGIGCFQDTPLREIDLAGTKLSRIGPKAFMNTKLTSLSANPSSIVLLDNIVEKCSDLDFLNIGKDVTRVCFTDSDYGNKYKTTVHLSSNNTQVMGSLNVPYVIAQSEEQANSITVNSSDSSEESVNLYRDKANGTIILF